MENVHDVRPDFGNWVSIRIIVAPLVVAAVFAAVSFLSLLLLIPAAIFLLVALYFILARYLFSPRGMNVQETIHSFVLDRLEWDGRGRALDIGCGGASLAISMARKYPGSTVVGTDYWGGNWEYSQKTCEDNARIEGVGERLSFRQASASSLPFQDGEFDAVVSNLVFHEVKDTRDKMSLVKEALRVLRKGGAFALQDLFYVDRFFGSPEEIVQTMRGWGVENVELSATKDSALIPAALKLPFMVGTLGLLTGKK